MIAWCDLYTRKFGRCRRRYRDEGRRPRLPVGDVLGQVYEGDELVDDGFDADEPPHDVAVLPRNAEQEGERRQRPPEQRLRMRTRTSVRRRNMCARAFHSKTD